MDREIRRRLVEIAGKEHVLLDGEARTCYAYDATNRPHLPDAVVFPGSAKEISRILRMANEFYIPVIPRGAGSGFTGGAVPVQGGVVLSTERMNRILRIDEEDLMAEVQPGVVTGDFQREVAQRGLFFPPDPASQDFCTLGGNVAECAGGMRALKYGVTRDYVLGLEVVLPTGEILRTGGRTVKNVVGYDLTRLIVGSEGTLGIVTEITLKLIPLPEARRTIEVFFASVEMAVRAVTEVFRARILPSAMELVDRASLDCVAKTRGLSFPSDTGAMLLIEVDGPSAGIDGVARAVQEVCLPLGPVGLKVSQDETEAEALWALRRAISPALARIRPHRLNEDIVVPRSRMPEAIRRFHEIARGHSVQLTSFGHAGDGNLHVNVLYDRADAEESARAESAAEAIMRATVEMGGSLSGEHGIGLTKSAFLRLEVEDEALCLMSRIKALLDPNGILNPGKIFPAKAPETLRDAKCEVQDAK
jgi:glycolate oxidase